MKKKLDEEDLVLDYPSINIPQVNSLLNGGNNSSREILNSFKLNEKRWVSTKNMNTNMNVSLHSMTSRVNRIAMQKKNNRVLSANMGSLNDDLK